MIEYSTGATTSSYRLTLASGVSEGASSRNVAAAAFLASAIVFASASLASANPVTHMQRDTAPTAHVILVSKADTALSTRSDFVAVAQIRDLTTYENGWSGPHSTPLGAKAEEAAVSFINYLAASGDFELPHIGLSNDGEANFYWRRDKAILDLGIDRNGKRSLFARLSSGEEIMQDEVAPDSPLPPALLELVAKSA